MSNRSITFAVVILSMAVLFAGALSSASGLPTLRSPSSLFSCIPAIAIAATPLNNPWLPFRTLVLSFLAAIPLMLAFLAWVLPGRSAPSIPMRSTVLLYTAGALSIPYFIFSWDYGLRFQGLTYTALLAGVNLVFIATCVAVSVYSRRAPTVALKLIFHGLLFVWLAWGAFPELGETL